MSLSGIDSAVLFQHTAARRRLGLSLFKHRPNGLSFNTQPPEGGWVLLLIFDFHSICFNTQPPEGGWAMRTPTVCPECGFNTQPPEGGWPAPAKEDERDLWFQHTAARRRLDDCSIQFVDLIAVSTHSRPKAAGKNCLSWSVSLRFQHTAARRRLAFRRKRQPLSICGFNTQPPEGGWPLC